MRQRISTTATYSYDAMGRRFATNVAGTQQEFLFNLAKRVLAVQNAATHSWTYPHQLLYKFANCRVNPSRTPLPGILSF